jgi:hypothetical protein
MNNNSRVPEAEKEIPMKSLVLIKNPMDFPDHKKMGQEQTEKKHGIIGDGNTFFVDHPERKNPLDEKLIIDTFINRNEINEVFSKGREEDDDHENAIQKIELEIKMRLGEIKERVKPPFINPNLNSSGSEAFQLGSERKSNTQFDKLSTPSFVESPTRKRTFTSQETKGSSQGTEKKKKTVVINTTLSNKKTEEDLDENDQGEMDSPSNVIKERVYKMIGGDAKNRQRMVDEFYQKMLRSEGIFQIPIEGGKSIYVKKFRDSY